jgi:hypothetical protein
MPPALVIAGLAWDEEREEHIERHIHAWEIDDLIEGGDFVAFPNRGDHPPNRWRIIGRTESGSFVTAVLQEPVDGNPLRWIPITGWRSTPYERKMFARERNRIGKKRGG